MTPKKIYVKTYGCQMNVYDSERIADVMAPHGYEPCDYPEQADMIVLNTCHIREKATEKVFSDLGRVKVFKDIRAQQGRHVVLAVAGCVAQAEGGEISVRAPYVDIVVGPQSYQHLPSLVAQSDEAFTQAGFLQRRAPVALVETEFTPEDKFDKLPLPENKEGFSSFLSIQEGCDKFCTFCVVPYTRGPEFSRPAASILEEARALVAQGVREITLLGQNVSAYRGASPSARGSWTLADLLRELAGISGLDRLRYTTSHPNDMQEDLLEAHRDCAALMPFLHLPVQSGSDAMLKAMNRHHTRARYLELIAAFREAVPHLAISSDFIVGFPGERDEDFEDTLSLIDAVGFAQSYSFAYSARPGTPAATLAGHLPPEVIQRRLSILQNRLSAQHRAFNEGLIGRTLPVLMERKGRLPGQLLGKSPYLQSVHAYLPEDSLGKICHIKIETATMSSLGGVPINLKGERKTA